MDPDRPLPPAEVSRVLRLASESGDLTTRDDEAPTLAHLEEAAREVGISPARVRRAAAIRPAPGTGAARVLLGAPDHRELEAVLPPRRSDQAADRRAASQALERALGRAGRLQELDDGFAWEEDHTLGRTRAVVREGADATEVRLTADRAGHYLASWFGGLVGWGLLAALTPLGSLGPVGAAVGFLAAPFLLARPWWVAQDKRLQARLEAAMMGLLEGLEVESTG